MSKVIVKHHQKGKHLKQQQKAQKFEMKDSYFNKKKEEIETRMRGNMKTLREKKNSFTEKMNQKFQRMSDNQRAIDETKHVYKQCLREQHMLRMMDQNENLQKIRRGQTAYKMHLVEKIIEKGNRAKEVTN